MAGAVEFTGDTVPLVAAADLSALQYRFVIVDGNGKCAAVTTEGDYALGILQNKPLSGEVAQIKVTGGSKLYIGDREAVNAGDLLTPDDQANELGEAVIADTAGNVARAVALEDGAVDTVISVLLLTLRIHA